MSNDDTVNDVNFFLVRRLTQAVGFFPGQTRQEARVVHGTATDGTADAAASRWLSISRTH